MRGFPPRAATRLSPAASPDLVREHGDDDDDTDGDLLPEGRDVQDVQAVAQDGDDERPDQRSQDPPFPTEQARAAQHDRSGRIQFVPLPASRPPAHDPLRRHQSRPSGRTARGQVYAYAN